MIFISIEDKDGNVTVVDENGSPVKSPPIVYTYEW